MASSVSTAAAVFMEVITGLQEWVRKWLEAKKNHAQFPETINRLKDDLEEWETELNKRTLPAEVTARIGKILNRVKSRIQQSEQEYASSRSRLSSSFRISSIGEKVHDIDRLLKSILQLLRENRERQDLLDHELQRFPVKEPPIPSDSRYVHRMKPEKLVFDALQVTHPARLILLCSSGGMGKSTVARNLITQCYECDHERQDQDEGGGRLDFSFKSMVFVSCVDSKDIKDTMAEIIRGMGHTPVPCASADSEKREVEREVQGNRNLLLRHLAETRALIVLDNVSDEEYLGRITELCGPGVKCLITSRNPDLLRRNDESICAVIHMEPLAEDEAMKILASHAGLANHFIPEYLGTIARKMVEKAEKIPLVLASLGSIIDSNRRYDIDEWELANENFSVALKSKPTAAVHKGIYRKSFWAATGLAVRELSEDAKKLLVLASVCSGPTVPEEILRILYDSGKFFNRKGNFSAARKDLERSQLVKIDPVDAVASALLGKRRQWSWSIHSLHRLYVGEELEQDQKSICKQLNEERAMSTSPGSTSGPSLMSNSSPSSISVSASVSDISNPCQNSVHKSLEDLIVEALCDLYLSWSSDMSGCELLRLRGLELLRRRAVRTAVAPIIFLVARPIANTWTSTDNNYAKQVLAAFTSRQRRVLPNCLAHLLKHPEASSATWMALKGMVNLYSSFYFMDKEDDELRTILMERLRDDVGSDMQAEALEVLGCARMLDFYEFVFNCNKSGSSGCDNTMVVALVGLLRRAPADSKVKAMCFRALANLVSWAWKNHHDATNAEKLARIPGLIDEIVSTLSSDRGFLIQEDAAKCLNQIMGKSSVDGKVGDIFKRKILEQYPIFLSGLEQVLSRNESALLHVQIELLEILVTLTTGSCPFILHEVADCDALMQAFARLLHEGLHCHAARSLLSTLLEVLYNLCRSRNSFTTSKVRGIEGLVNGLRSVLAEADISEGSQSMIVRAAGLFILLDPLEAGLIDLQSAAGFRARGEAYHELNMDEESKKDICQAHMLDSKYATDLYREFNNEKSNDKWSRAVAKLRPLRHCLSMNNKRREFADDERATKWKYRWVLLINQKVLQVTAGVNISEARGPPKRKR